MTAKALEAKARQLRTHTVVYTDRVDILAAVLAMQGQTTKSIALELGITESQAQYRIKKAQDTLKTRFRSDYRNGVGKFADYVRRTTQRRAQQVVSNQIAPVFAPLAANRGQ